MLQPARVSVIGIQCGGRDIIVDDPGHCHLASSVPLLSIDRGAKGLAKGLAIAGDTHHR
jgi:hypothetical protein